MIVPTPVMHSIESPAVMATPLGLQTHGLPGMGNRAGDTGLANLHSSSSPATADNDAAMISPQESGAASVATHVTSGSNAFEGALDGLDFGLDLFGMDSAMPFSGSLLAPGYTNMEM